MTGLEAAVGAMSAHARRDGKDMAVMDRKKAGQQHGEHLKRRVVTSAPDQVDRLAKHVE